MRNNMIFKSLGIGCLFFILTVTQTIAKKLPDVGETVEAAVTFTFPAPGVDEHRTYLNLAVDQDGIALQNLDKTYILIEIVGAYCPICHTQAPDMVRLFHRIQRDAVLSEKVGMVAVAAGGTPMEVEHLNRSWRFPFPILRDGDYSLHKLLGEPDTPFTFLVDREGYVHYAHLGRIDPNTLFDQIKKLP